MAARDFLTEVSSQWWQRERYLGGSELRRGWLGEDTGEHDRAGQGRAGQDKVKQQGMTGEGSTEDNATGFVQGKLDDWPELGGVECNSLGEEQGSGQGEG